MYIQWFVKGISSAGPGGQGVFTWADAKGLILAGHGIVSNWWRNKPGNRISPPEIEAVLTSDNLNRHVHDYASFGSLSPFISVASGCVERDALLGRNNVYSAIDTALAFATEDGRHPGALFYGWLPVGLNPAVELSAVGESIRDLNVYHRWSPFQLEGEITAKINIPANQIEKVEWWDLSVTGHQDTPVDVCNNSRFVAPTPLLNARELF
ncbi:MAG: hypothetical protein ACTHND_11935 [Asticcacaulis sp.]